MRNTQTTAHLPRAYSTSHAQKALNRIRVYVRFRAHVTVFCLGDGECRSAFDGPKPLITRRCQRNSVHGPCDQKINSAPTTDRETVWRRSHSLFPYGLFKSRLSFILSLLSLKNEHSSYYIDFIGLFGHNDPYNRIYSTALKGDAYENVLPKSQG